MSFSSFLLRQFLIAGKKPRFERLSAERGFGEVQQKTLLGLVRRARRTQFGLDHGFERIKSVQDYQKQVPLRTYEDFFNDYFLKVSKAASQSLHLPYDHLRMSPYLENVTWPGPVSFFSLSSGTTSGSTKFIPLTKELIRANHKAAFDLLALYLMNRENNLLGGKIFLLGGNVILRDDWAGKVKSGDLSGVLAVHLPPFFESRYFPGSEIAAITDWEEKMERSAQAALNEDIRILAGVPSWVLLFLDKLNQKSGFKGNIRKVWPQFELFIHGGISIEPYKDRFREMLGPKVDYMEVYPASEGFIAIEDPHYRALRLMVDYGIFYEFVPVEALSEKTPARLTLNEIEIGRQYAIIITTNGGLWSYVLGDTVRFISKAPPLLKVTGRTKFYLSAFGEHVIQEEIEKSLEKACEKWGALFTDYHVAPIFPNDTSAAGRHQFLIEFLKPPADFKSFAAAFDESLKDLNEDYAAHRAHGFGLEEPEMRAVPQGFFTGWMKSKGKLGGQHKVPRIANKRILMEEMIGFLKQKENSGIASL